MFAGCGGAFSAPSGNIHSPNYPNMYNHDDDCGWLITVDFGHVVQLTFSDFDLEHQTNCRYMCCINESIALEKEFYQRHASINWNDANLLLF